MEEEISTNYLPYEGEYCHVCDRRLAVKVVLFEGGQVSLCRYCKAKQLLNKED